jgi:hypothetical protein
MTKQAFVIIVSIPAIIWISGCASTPKANSYVSKIVDKSKEILAADMSFDVDQGIIRYSLPEPALVRIRIGRQAGAMLHILLDWEPRDAGPHVERWDTMDVSKVVSFKGYRDLVVILSALPISKDRRAAYQGNIRGQRKSPRFDIQFPSVNHLKDDDIPVVSGEVPMRIILNELDRKWLTEVHYEIIIYIDQIFITEEEQGMNPFTYMIDTRQFNEGEHVITVNLASYNGEIGTISRKIFVKNE